MLIECAAIYDPGLSLPAWDGTTRDGHGFAKNTPLRLDNLNTNKHESSK